MKNIYIIISIIILTISIFSFSQTRRTKEDDFTKSSFVVNENERIFHTIIVCDPDGDIVNISIDNPPDGLMCFNVHELINFVLKDPNSCPECIEGSSWYALDIEWTPNYHQAGIYKIYIHAEDDKGGEDWINYVFIVNEVNRPPVL